MMERSADELTLRDVLAILRRQRTWIFTFPVLLGTVALVYGFFVAEPLYASTATVNMSPVQVQAQLEQRIQVQGQNLFGFQGIRALAYSEKVIREVWETLKKENLLPPSWQSQDGTPNLGRMVKDLKIKEESTKQQTLTQVVVSFTVQAPFPEVAAKAANLWASVTIRELNRIPTTPLETNLRTLEQLVTSAERAYQKARDEWQAFMRSSTLDMDLAELTFLQGIPFEGPTAQTLVFGELPGERLRLQKELMDLQLAITTASPQEKGVLLSRKRAVEETLKKTENRIALLRERISRARAEQEQLRQSLELAKNTYLALAQKKTDVQIELASSQNTLAQVIAPAYPIYEKVAPKRGLIFALAVVLGLMLGVIAAFVAEALRPEETPKAA